jgi:hypothetical protein
VVLDESCTCTFETYDVPTAAPVAVASSAPSADVDETDETVASMLDALELADDDHEEDEADAPPAADTSAVGETPANVAPPVEETPKRGWPLRVGSSLSRGLKRTVSAMSSVGDQTPAVYADPIMAGVTPTFTKLLVQSFERRALKGQWVTLEHATPYGDLPPGKLRLLQMDVYEVKNGLEMTSDGTKYIVPAGRFTHYIVRGPVERNGYCAHSAKLGQQVTFDPNVD